MLRKLCTIGDGNRFSIPDKGPDSVLKMLHSVHKGISIMKTNVRSVTWCLNMHKKIEEFVNSCLTFQMYAKDNPKIKKYRMEDRKISRKNSY